MPPHIAFLQCIADLLIKVNAALTSIGVLADMELLTIIDANGENWTLTFGGAVIGAIFGAFAQLIKFCLRAAAVEFSRGSIGAKTSIWLLVFFAAIVGMQLLHVMNIVATNEARQIASPQSLSGALIAWICLFAIWFSAGVTDWIIDRKSSVQPIANPA